MKRYFAVGMRGWVEIRSAPDPPKPHTSTTFFKGTKSVGRWEQQENDPYNALMTYVIKQVPVKTKMTTTIYTGGRVLMTLKSHQFRRFLRVSVLNGGLLELSEDQFNILKTKEERGIC